MWIRFLQSVVQCAIDVCYFSIFRYAFDCTMVKKKTVCVLFVLVALLPFECCMIPWSLLLSLFLLLMCQWPFFIAGDGCACFRMDYRVCKMVNKSVSSIF